MTFNSTIRCVLAAAALTGALQAATVFNFDTDSLGTASGFTDTVNGMAATFSSSLDPGGFVVYQSMFETLTGNVLGDPGPAGIDGLNLSVLFSQNLSAVTLNFATDDFNTPSPLTLTAFEGVNQVGSVTSTGQFLNGFLFPEGEIALSGLAFNRIVISSTAMDFAVDNITVVGTPEPAPLALFALGLLAMGIPAAKRMFRATAK